MHYAVAGDKRPVLYHHVAAEECSIGDDDVIAKLAVVSNVAMSHEKIV